LFIAAGGGHLNLNRSHLSVRHPADGCGLTIGIRPERLGVLVIGEACAGSFQGEAEYNIGAFHGLIVLVEDLNDQRGHDLVFQVIHLLIACERHHL